MSRHDSFCSRLELKIKRLFHPWLTNHSQIILNQSNWTQLNEDDNIDEFWDLISRQCQKLTEKHVENFPNLFFHRFPSRFKNQFPWFQSNLQHLVRKIHDLCAAILEWMTSTFRGHQGSWSAVRRFPGQESHLTSHFAEECRGWEIPQRINSLQNCSGNS